MSFRDYIFENSIYICLASTTLSRLLTMHLSNLSSIAQHLKKHSYATSAFQKILSDNTTILEQQNNKDYRLTKTYTSETNIQNSIELILNPVLMYSNVFSYSCYS